MRIKSCTWFVPLVVLILATSAPALAAKRGKAGEPRHPVAAAQPAPNNASCTKFLELTPEQQDAHLAALLKSGGLLPVPKNERDDLPDCPTGLHPCLNLCVNSNPPTCHGTNCSSIDLGYPACGSHSGVFRCTTGNIQKKTCTSCVCDGSGANCNSTAVTLFCP